MDFQAIAVLFILLALWEVTCLALVPHRFLGKSSGKMFAKFTPGAIVSEVRGKIAATVFSKNKSGAVLRNRVTPINRKSPGQTEQRQTLAALSASWRGLTQAERDSWDSAAPNFPQSDNLGQTIFLTGAQLYSRCNANLILSGNAQITVAPAPTSFDVLYFTSVTVTADDGVVSLAFAPTVPAGMEMVVRATPPISAGKSFVPDSSFRFLKSIAAAQTSPQVLTTEYGDVFGSLTNATGQKIFIELFFIEAATGLAGIPVRGYGVVAAT